MSAALEGGCACGAVRYRLGSAPMFVRSYDMQKLWPTADTGRRRTIVG